MAQLASLRYQHNARGQVVIESKENARQTISARKLSPGAYEEFVAALHDGLVEGYHIQFGAGGSCRAHEHAVGG